MARSVCSSLILLMALSSGCSSSSSSVVNEWRDPSVAGAPYRKVLVIALGRRPEVRRAYEGQFARALGERGAEAIQGYALLPDDISKIDRPALLKAVADSGADGVIITRLKKMEQRTLASAPPYTPPTTSLHGYHETNWSKYDDPESDGGQQVQAVATLETSLFDARSARLAWRATTETVDANAAQQRLPVLVKTLVDAMVKAKVIP